MIRVYRSPDGVVAAAVDATGKATAFTLSVEGCVWALGERVPVRVAGRIDLRQGTSYSAALTAGVAGRLVAERPKLTAQEAMRLLRSTSRKQPGGRS